MVKITYVTAAGDAHIVEAAPGHSLMEVARFNDIDGIEAVCGGNSYCGTCRVHVSEEWRSRLAEPSELERELVDSLGYDDPSARLSCQIEVADNLHGLVVHIPAQQQ